MKSNRVNKRFGGLPVLAHCTSASEEVGDSQLLLQMSQSQFWYYGVWLIYMVFCMCFYQRI